MRVGDSKLELAEARSYLGAVGYFVLSGVIPERTAYRRASDTGRAVTETTFPSLNKKADHLAQAVINRLEELTNRGIMAKPKIKPPRGTKGEPVQEPSATLTRSDELVALNFKVSPDFRREFRTYASERDISMVELLKDAYREYREKHG